MKKFFSLLALLLFTVTTAWAGETFTYTLSGGKAVSSPSGFFSYDTQGKFNFNTKYTGCTYEGVEYSHGLKMEGTTKILFTTTEAATVTIVQSSWSSNTIKMDGTELNPVAESGYNLYTVKDVAAGEHNITRGSGEVGLFLVKVEYADKPKTVSFINDAEWTKVYVWAWNSQTQENFTGGEWPGKELTPGQDGTYSWETMGAPDLILFNDGGQNQTADLEFKDGGVYKSTGRVINLNEYTATFATDGMDEVYAYAWNGDEKPLGEWPGEKMEGGNGRFTITIKAEDAPKYIIFHDNKGNQTPDWAFEDGKSYAYMLQDFSVSFKTDAKWESTYAYIWSGEGDNVKEYTAPWPGNLTNDGTYSFKAFVAPENIQFNNGKEKTGDLKFVNDKAYEWITAEPLYKLNEGDSFAAGSTVEVKDAEQEVVATITYGSTGNAFTAAIPSTVDNWAAYGAMTAGNGTNGDLDGGTVYTIVPKYDGTISVAVRLNAGKNFYIKEDGTAIQGYDGITIKDTENTSFDFAVTANKSYAIYCSGSKLGFFGFDYKFDKPAPQLEGYYVVGTMTETEWAYDEAYKLTPGADGSTLFTLKDKAFKAGDQFKVKAKMSDDTEIWYPEGLDNNYEITQDGEYTITFNPAGNVEGWHGGYFNVVMKEQPIILNDYTVQFINGANWDEVFAYTWTGKSDAKVEQLNPWAGTAMGLTNTFEEIDGIRYPVYELKFQHAIEPDSIIFSDGKGGEVGKTQTENLAFENNHKYQLIIKPQLYNVNIAEIENGTVLADPIQAEAGATITLTARPAEGYELDGEIMVTCAHEDKVIPVENGTFVMPDDDVTVSATFKAIPELVGYFVVGSMNEWNYDEAYQMTPNNEQLYQLTKEFKAGDKFKVKSMMSDKSFAWYPDGTDNDFEITQDGEYTITFNPAGNVEGWHGGYFNVVMKEEPIDPQPAEPVVFTFNTDDGIAELGIAKPEAGKGTNLADLDPANTLTKGGVTITSTDGSTATRVWNSKGTLDFRIYQTATLTFKAADKNIKKIELAGGTVNVFTADGGKFADGVWEGDASEVTLTATGTGKINTITVTYGEAGGDVPQPVVINSMAINGTFPGMSWDADKGIAMTKSVDNEAVWTLTMENVTVEGQKYEYKAYANGETTGYQLPSAEQGNADFVFGTDKYPAGEYTLTFTANTKNHTLTLDVKKNSINTIKELNAQDNGTEFTFVGDAIVVAKVTKGTSTNYVYIKDETGSSLIYDQTGENTADLGIGNVITTPWTGKVSIYKNLFEAIPTVALGSTSTVQVKYPEVTADYVKAENMNQVVLIKGLSIEDVDTRGNIKFTIGDAVVPGYNQFGIKLEFEGNTFDVVGAISVFNENVQFQPITITEAQEPQPAGDTWTVAGNLESLFGTAWDPANTANDMTLTEGLYTWEKNEVTLTTEEPIQFKVVKNHSWDEAYPENDYMLNIPADGVYGIKITFNAETKEVKAETTGGPELNTYTANFENTGNWAAVYAYTWSGEGEAKVEELGAWPGQAVRPDAETGKYTVTIKAENAPQFIIFHNNDGIQTEGLAFVDGETYKYEKPEPQPTVEKLYIIGNGTENEWKNTTEVTFNEQTSAFEYEITAKEECYIAFGDAELNDDWNTFNGSHRYALVAGKNVVPTIGEALQLILTQGEGCVVLAPGYKYALSVTKDLKLTVTREELPAQKFTASFSNTGNWAEVWAYTFSKDAEGQQTEELGGWPGTKLEQGTDGLYKVEIEAAVAPQYIIFNNGIKEGEGAIQTENLKFENGKAYEYKQPQKFGVDFKTGKNWEKVYAYTYGPEVSGPWPGTELVANNGIYTYGFEATEAPGYIIFNNGTEAEVREQTPDYVFENGKTYEYEVEPTPEEKEFTVQFVNNRGWEQGNVRAYAWNTNGQVLGDWPGTPMGLIDTEVTYGGEKYEVYELKFKAAAAPEFIIFNNGQGGNDNQTEDLVFVNEKQYLVLPMKGELACSVKEPMQLDYSDNVKMYNGMPMIIWGQPMLDSKVTFKVGDALHIRIVECPGMRSPGLQLMSDDGKTPITENLAAGLKEVPAIITIPITGAVYEWMKDADHRVRLNGQNVFIDRMTVEPDVYPAAETPAEEETTVSVWVPENAEGEQIAQEEKVEIPATPFVVVDVKKEEIVKIKASDATTTSRGLGGAVTGLAEGDISILKKNSTDLLVADDQIRVSDDGSGYEFTVSDEATVTELKTNGFDIKNRTEKPLVIKAIEVQQVLPVEIVYNFAAAAAAEENPENLNFGSAFYGWENEGKTYSKRQDYKGYTNYTGTNLPAECHVFRRSDRINGNIGNGGLKCPNQREMAINGLTAGQKVVIEYTGDGQMLYATGYDPANATAEPNTVAIVGDGNKAAISGTTTIASGTPIHIVSTDNGYFVFRVLKNMVITKITISDEATPIDPATVVKPNKVIVAAEIENGTVKVQAQACAGDEVTVTATPAEGFKLEAITVTGVTSNEAVPVTDGKFTMPADDVTVNATFTDTRVIYDFAAAAAAEENPENLNFGSAFYGWENEGKTYSKRQDYKGYTNYTGTNLPAECHVFRRSDRINGNIGNGGLKCPNQREMAINGLTAGQKVVIEYTGDGQMLYATGYDPANATAEPNTVAIVGDGNKAAISGTTTIASGTPIHIVSTDNGYFVFRVLKNMVITKITISDEATPIDPATVVKPNKVIVAAEIENGTVKVQAQACAGDEVTVTATPAEGYELEAITVKDADENEITVTDGKFIMPAKAVTVSATFKKIVDYYLTGNMTEWGPKADYKLTLNTEAAPGVVEYMITLDLATTDMFKIARSDDGTTIVAGGWYPDGMENSYGEHGEITETANYTVYFRPNADGNADWFYNVIYVVKNGPATGINNIDNDAVAGEKDVYYNLQGVRVSNPGKGVYIKNGKKVLVK